jgi:hypothetical protein
VHPQPELVHVPDDEARDERAQVAASAREVDGEVAARHDEQDGDRGRLPPDPRSPLRDRERQDDAEEDPEARGDPEVEDELAERLGQGAVPLEDERCDGEREHRAGGVVQGRLGHDRLRDLRPQAHPLEERDENRRVGRREHCPDQEAGLDWDVERECRRRARDERGDEHARDGEQPEADGDRAQDGERQPEPAVEEDHGDAEGQEDLDGDRLEGQVERASDVGAEQGPRADEHDHAWDAQNAGQELRPEARRQEEGEDLDDVARGHRADCGPFR